MIRSFFTFIFIILLSRSMTTSWCCSSHRITFTSHTYFLPVFPINSISIPHSHVGHAQLFFITELQQSSDFYISLPDSIPPMHTFKALNTFSHTIIEIPQRKEDFIRTYQIPFTCYFIIKTNFLSVWSAALWLMCIYNSYHLLF